MLQWGEQIKGGTNVGGNITGGSCYKATTKVGSVLTGCNTWDPLFKSTWSPASTQTLKKGGKTPANNTPKAKWCTPIGGGKQINTNVGIKVNR